VLDQSQNLAPSVDGKSAAALNATGQPKSQNALIPITSPAVYIFYNFMAPRSIIAL
jgi:hypothetical protein